MMGAGLVLPMLPHFFLNQNSSFYIAYPFLIKWQLLLNGSVTGIWALGGFLGSPFIGNIADKTGRKKTLFFCLFIMLAGYYVMYLSTIFGFLFVFLLMRFVTGFFGGIFGLIQSIAIDIGKEKKDIYLSIITLGATIGFMLGPLLSYITSNKNISSLFTMGTPFFVYCILILLNIICLLGFKYKQKIKKTKLKIINLKSLFTSVSFLLVHKNTRMMFIVFVVTRVAFNVFILFIAIYTLRILHRGDNSIFIAFMLLGVGGGLGTLFMSLLSNKISNIKKIIAGLMISIIVSILMSYFTSFYIAYSFILFLGFLNIITYVSFISLVSSLVQNQHLSLAMGGLASGFFISNVIAAIIQSLVSQYLGVEYNFYVIALTFLLGLIIFAIFINKEKKQQTVQQIV